jgi:hypothetical protein
MTHVRRTAILLVLLGPGLALLAACATAMPTALPTVAPVPTPTPSVEERIVQVEWPARLHLGDSDVVRLALIPSGEGYTVTSEFPEQALETHSVAVNRRDGYELNAVARLDGSGFEIAPQGEQVRLLPRGEAVAWRWSLRPLAPGQQRLAVSLTLRWTPAEGDKPAQEAHLYSRGLEVQIISFLGLTRAQAMATGLLGLIFGSLLSASAFTWRRKGGLIPALLVTPDPSVQLEPPAGMDLNAVERSLLQSLFRRYAKLVIQQEFPTGYSGARTFLVLPIRVDGGADTSTIARVGVRSSIELEYANYESFVKDTLPPVTARIQHAPITTRGSSGLAALQYTFIGMPGSPPLSLRQALLENPDPALLEKLFETFGPGWWMQRRPYTFRLAQEYDRMLPAHLVLAPASGKGRPLDGRTPPGKLQAEVGDIFTLWNFHRWEIRSDGKSLAGWGQAASGQPRLRVRWLGLGNPDGQTGKVVATRATMLAELTAGLNLASLPNPLARLPAVLEESVQGSQSAIHGDLNLENVLVGSGGIVWLIDFASARDGHTLFDFAHLEAEIIAHLLASQVKTVAEYMPFLENLYSGDINPTAPTEISIPDTLSPYQPLLSTLHSIAYRCLQNPGQPGEYHRALYAACLGAIKFASLDLRARQLLLLTAAYLDQLIS